jgi:hypothetical protein
VNAEGLYCQCSQETQKEDTKKKLSKLGTAGWSDIRGRAPSKHEALSSNPNTKTKKSSVQLSENI